VYNPAVSYSEYSFLDRPEILQYVFFPRPEWGSKPPGASDHLIPVTDSVSISARLFSAPGTQAFFLYFHGNGEIACDYDWSAPDYNALGVHLFVADYRGYGRSGGLSDFSNMLGDAPAIFKYARELAARGSITRFYLMGRSLGSIPAITLAAAFPGEYQGLILESGLASVPRIMQRMGLQVPSGHSAALEEEVARRLASITCPALVLHGEIDDLIPVEEGRALYAGLASTRKELVIIPGAGHNDIGLTGHDLYFAAIRRFLAGSRV
jgi:alpha-beta hydrolase superfamily lysophospholipase